MVERKKTGLAKARKAVRILCILSVIASTNTSPFSIPGSSGSRNYLTLFVLELFGIIFSEHLFSDNVLPS